MIYTFYSYKGGVGRSMAMAAVAYLFATRGLRVLAIDFDLEAPGLERYYFDAGESRRVRSNPGLIDLILEYKRALTSEVEFERATFKQWRRFVTDAVPTAAGGGIVDLMTAGCREPADRLADYARAVRTFDWQDFLDNWNGAQFFEWLRLQLTTHQLGYDVVLIDTRTGVTEMGGVCAYQLADVAVMLCAANYQNLDGTLAVANDFRSNSVIALRAGRPLELLIVPSRIDPNHPDRERFLSDFEAVFKTDGLPLALAQAGLGYRQLILPYETAYAIAEQLVGAESEAAVSHGDPNLATVFGRLADALTLLADGGKLSGQKGAALARLKGEEAEAALPVADVTKRGAGFDVFLDYAYDDRVAAEALEKQLHTAGLSVANELGSLQLSADWSEQLERSLAYSQTLVVLMGKSGPSAHRETLISRARFGRKTIVPVLLGHDVPASMLASFGLSDRQAVVLETPSIGRGSGDFDKLVAALSARKEDAPGASQEYANPYPGRRPFAEDDAAFFFGREKEVEELYSEIQRHDVVYLTGASAVGKTSLVCAGLLPKLRADGAGGSPWSIEIVDLSGDIAKWPSATEPPPALPRRLLVLENVDSDRWLAFERVRGIVGTPVAGCKILLCGRGAPEQTIELDMLLWTFSPTASPPTSTRYILSRMQPDMLKQAIERPCQRQRHLFESGLIGRLLADASSADAPLALIQMILPTLWKERRRGWLTNQAYDAVGGINGCVSARRQALQQEVTAEDMSKISVFLSNLVALDTNLNYKGESRAWSELQSIPALGPHPEALRDTLAAAHLIVVDASTGTLFCSLAASEATSCVYDSDLSVEFMLWRQRFSTFVQAWRTQRALVAGSYLAEAEIWNASYSDRLNADERELIDASRLEADEARQRERQQRALNTARELAKDAQSRLEEQRALQSDATTGELRESANKLLAILQAPPKSYALDEAMPLIERLRDVRDYEAMGLLVESVSRLDGRNSKVRRLYGHFLIESGKATAAIDVLTQACKLLGKKDDPEMPEIYGLLGRAHKQLFLEAVNKRNPTARLSATAAIVAYRKPYEQDPNHIWHGLNLLGMASMARRLRLRAKRVEPQNVARQLLATLQTLPEYERDEWYLPALAEVHTALSDWDAVESTLSRYLADPNLTAFSLASLLRQLTQVWDLDHAEARTQGLVHILRAKLAQIPGASVEYGAKEIKRMRVQPAPVESQLEAVLGDGGNRSYQWWRVGLERAPSVAMIQRAGTPFGTGFLVRARDLGLNYSDNVLLTAFHVVDEVGALSGLRPGEAQVVFEGDGSTRRFDIAALVWSSPATQLDVSVLRLKPSPDEIAPLPLTTTLPDIRTDARVHVIGHAGGRSQVSFSFNDNTLIDHEGPPTGKPTIPGVCRVHYNAETEPGSGGSPVFNDDWDVIAMHHSGGRSMPKLNGLPGTYAAKEGIAIASIVEAIKQSVPSNELQA